MLDGAWAHRSMWLNEMVNPAQHLDSFLAGDPILELHNLPGARLVQLNYGVLMREYERLRQGGAGAVPNLPPPGMASSSLSSTHNLNIGSQLMPAFGDSHAASMSAIGPRQHPHGMAGDKAPAETASAGSLVHSQQRISMPHSFMEDTMSTFSPAGSVGPDSVAAAEQQQAYSGRGSLMASGYDMAAEGDESAYPDDLLPLELRQEMGNQRSGAAGPGLDGYGGGSAGGGGWQPTNYQMPNLGPDKSPFAPGAGLASGQGIAASSFSGGGAGGGVSQGGLQLARTGGPADNVLPQDLVRAIERMWPSTASRSSNESLCQVGFAMGWCRARIDITASVASTKGEHYTLHNQHVHV